MEKIYCKQWKAIVDPEPVCRIPIHLVFVFPFFVCFCSHVLTTNSRIFCYNSSCSTGSHDESSRWLVRKSKTAEGNILTCSTGSHDESSRWLVRTSKTAEGNILQLHLKTQSIQLAFLCFNWRKFNWRSTCLKRQRLRYAFFGLNGHEKSF